MYTLQEQKIQKPVSATMLNIFKCDILVKAYKVVYVNYLVLANLILK